MDIVIVPIQFDVIVDKVTFEVIFNDTREECLNWCHKNKDQIDDILVGMYGYTVLRSGWEYVNMYT